MSGFSRTWEDDMRSKWVAGGILIVVFAAGAAAGAVAQQQASPTRREPQFENEHVGE